MSVLAVRTAVGFGAAISAQLFVSATSLILTFLLMHVLPLHGYAAYVLAAAAALFASGFFNATYVSRVAVSIGGESEGNIREVVARGLTAAGCAGAVVAALGVVVAFVLRDPVLGCVWVFCGLTLARDGAIRIANAAGRRRSAAVGAAVYCLLALATGVVPLRAGAVLSLQEVMAGLSLAMIAGAGTIYLNEGVSVREVAGGAADVIAWGRRLLTLRDWLAGGFLVIWAQAQAVLFVASHYLGSPGVAALGAVRVFSSPLVFLSQALSPIVIARASARECRADLYRKYIGAAAVFSAAYVVVAVPLAMRVWGALFPAGIAADRAVVTWSVALGALQFFKDAVRYVAIGRRRDREVWWASVSGCAASVAVCGATIAVGVRSLAIFVAAFCVGEALSALLLVGAATSARRLRE